MSALPATVEEDRVEWHLRNWKAWQQKGGLRLGYSSRASGGIGKSGSTDFDAMCANADNSSAVAVDTIIDDLPQRERLAIYNEWLCTVFRFEGDALALYESGVNRLAKGLRARGIW